MSALLHGNWLRDRVAVPCHISPMTKFDVVPRGQGYWLEAVAEDGTRTPLERLDTKARALERIRVLEGRERLSKRPKQRRSATPSKKPRQWERG